MKNPFTDGVISELARQRDEALKRCTELSGALNAMTANTITITSERDEARAEILKLTQTSGETI